jgi:hypothetical protein
MKQIVKLSVLSMLMLALVVFTIGCGGEKAASNAEEGSNGSAESVAAKAPKKSGADALSLLPQEATGLFTVNFDKMSKMEFFEKMLEEEDKADTDPNAPFKNYKDFVEKTGIDFKENIHEMTIAFVGSITSKAGNEPQIISVVKLDYDKSTIDALLKNYPQDVTLEEYNGVAIYTAKGKTEKEKIIFALLDSGLAVGGNTADLVKKSIDLYKGTGNSIKDNELLMSNLNNLKSNVLMNLVMEFPEEGKKASGGPMPVDLSKAQAITGTFDYEDKTVKGEIQIITAPNQAENAKIAATLSGLKMMAASGGQEFMELVNNINITATDTSIKLAVTLTEELIAKLQKKINEKNAQMETLSDGQ